MAQRFEQDGVIYEDAGNGQVRVVGYSRSPQSIQTKPADPNQALDRVIKQTQIGKAMRDAANAPAEARKTAADARKAEAEAAKAERENATSNNPTGLTAEARSAAIKSYQQLTNLDRGIEELEQRYKRDFEPNKGVRGLREYAPGWVRPANRQFDDASGGLSAFIATALSLSGQQFNTPAEQQLFLGSILPKSSDRDEVIASKITRLKALAATARTGGEQMLGGRPDRNGRIVPASGETQSRRNEEAEGLVNMLIRSGSTPDEINAALKPLGLGPVDPKQVKQAQEYYRQNPKDRSGVAEIVEERPTNLLNRISASPAGAFFASAGNGVTAGLLDEGAGAIDSLVTGKPIGQAISEADRAKQMLARANPTSSFAGEMLGTSIGAYGSTALMPGRAAAALGARAPLVADVAYGAAYGAGQNNEDRVLGGLVGAGSGYAGNRIGQGAANLAGRATRGVRDEAVNLLRHAGIRQTGGQMLGGPIRSLEDAATSFPVLGDLIRTRRLEGVEDFNRVAFDEAGAPINFSTQGTTGARGVDMLRQARSDQYGRVLDPVTLEADPEFGADITNAYLRAADLPPAMADNAEATLNMRVADNFGGAGELSGNDLQQSIRGLRRDARSMEQQPYGYDFGQVAGDAESALEGLLQRQSPGTLPEYRAANEANRRMEVIRDAVNRARNGSRSGEVQQFMPSQLADAAAVNARRFGNNAGTTSQPFFELTEAAQSVLPSTIPDSGTAARLLPATLGTAALGGGAGYVAGGEEGFGTGAGLAGGTAATLALLNTRGGQAALARILLERSNRMQRLGDFIVDRAAIPSGRLGASGGSVLAIEGTR